jgi:carbamoyl-phosphate synthase large subunit
MGDESIRVALLGFGGAGSGSVGVSVGRALRAGAREALELVALGEDPFIGGAWTPGLIDRVHLLPDDAPHGDARIEHILDIHGDRRLDALIVCDHAAVAAIAASAERLADAGLATLVPRADRLAAAARPRLSAFCRKHDLPTPPSLFVPSTDDVVACAEQLGFPLWLKGPLDGATKIHSATQTREAVERLGSAARDGVLLQRVVEGETFDVGMVVDRRGRSTGLVAARRLAVNDEGQVVSGSVVDDPQLERVARRVLEALHWRGALELELARASGDAGGRGRLYVCDLRARLPAWSMLTHWSECNLPARLLDAVLDREPPTRTGPRPGRIYVRGIAETAIPLDHLVRLDRRRQAAGIPAPADRAEDAPADRAEDAPADGATGRGLRVAVTGLSSFDVINPGIGVARALRRAPGISRIYGLSYGTFDSGIYEAGLFDACFQLPVGESAPAMLARLQEIQRNQPFDVVIPCLDGELARFIAIRDALEQADIATLLPTRESLDRRAKPRLFGGAVATDWGSFELPESIVARSEEEVLDAARTLGFPVAVKGPVAQCIPARCRDEASAAWRRLTAFGTNEVILQPFIPGKFFAVSTVLDRDHRPLSSLTVKKLAICERGSTWSAIPVENPRLEADCNRLLGEIGWVGPAELEFIRDELRDRYYLIEVNPRFTAWIYFSACLGINQPAIAVHAAAGEDMPAGTDAAVRGPSGEKVFLRANHELPVKATSLAAISTKGYVHHDHL